MTKPQQSLKRQHERFGQETREGLSDSSSASVRKAPGGEPWGNDHPVNIRLSIPLLFTRYYLTVVAGKERRHPERRENERRKHPFVTFGNLVAMLGLGTVCGLALLGLFQLAGAYLLTQFGIMVVPQ